MKEIDKEIDKLLKEHYPTFYEKFCRKSKGLLLIYGLLFGKILLILILLIMNIIKEVV